MKANSCKKGNRLQSNTIYSPLWNIKMFYLGHSNKSQKDLVGRNEDKCYMTGTLISWASVLLIFKKGGRR